ncbi:uncharacterized protein MKZ38_009681 [Zalerion maritima]|uniref:Uncharacterized protein n=1 Tax=Zalerion maritima TaxID=339359 RepID=A0AAD5WVK4_9PEZI|nr:uncharacterized protein MKZ38_009681 [Zalerion maritima]
MSSQHITKVDHFEENAKLDPGAVNERGAYGSEKAVHSFIPEFAPGPVAYGAHKSKLDMHSCLTEFVEMDDLQADAKAWASYRYDPVAQEKPGKVTQRTVWIPRRCNASQPCQPRDFNWAWLRVYSELFSEHGQASLSGTTLSIYTESAALRIMSVVFSSF